MEPIRFPPVDMLLHRSTVKPIEIALPVVVEHQSEDYENGITIHSIKAPWSTGLYLGHTKEEALANMIDAYRLVHNLANKAANHLHP